MFTYGGRLIDPVTKHEAWIVWDETGFPICTCDRESDAKRIISALNFEAVALRALREIGRPR